MKEILLIALLFTPAIWAYTRRMNRRDNPFHTGTYDVPIVEAILLVTSVILAFIHIF